jgi:hypothetical protein
MAWGTRRVDLQTVAVKIRAGFAGHVVPAVLGPDTAKTQATTSGAETRGGTPAVQQDSVAPTVPHNEHVDLG